MFGFQATPQNSSGTKIGTLVNTGASTQIVSSNKYITHTSSGITGSGSKSWSFNWIAPATGTGTATIYAAFNITNADGTTNGDICYLSTLVIPENTTGISSLGNEMELISIFPNPSNDYIIVKVNENNFGKDFYISDIKGKKVAEGKLLNKESTHVDLTKLHSGVYFMRVLQTNLSTIKFVKE